MDVMETFGLEIAEKAEDCPADLRVRRIRRNFGCEEDLN
jgi:hypothetical protein